MVEKVQRMVGAEWRKFAAASMVALACASGVADVAQGQSSRIDQSRFPTGHLLPKPGDFEAFPRAQLTRAYIPEAVDLSDRFPVPRQQKHASCVAWAVGYAARSYYARLETGSAKHEPPNIASPAYIYNRTFDRNDPKGCAEAGSTIADALRLLQSEGSATLADYESDATCEPVKAKSTAPTPAFRIKSARHLADFPRLALNLDLAKQQLAAGHPIIVGMRIDNAFVSLRPTDIYMGIPNPTPENLAKANGHAVVVVGYDERRDAFRLMNSWATDWADGGFGWVSSGALRAQTTDAWVMDASQPPKPAAARPVSPKVELPKPVADALEADRCHDVQISRVKGASTERDDKMSRARLTGFVARALQFQEMELFAAVMGGENEVKLRPWPICEAMLTLREPMRAASRPKVELIGGDRVLKVGERFAFQVTPPNVPSFLYVVYLEDDGTVVNLAPRRGPIRRQTDPKAPPLIFGDGQGGRSTFTVTPLKAADVTGRPRVKGDPERGHEAVVVIAARAPIDELEKLEEPGNEVYRRPAREAASAAKDAPPDRLFLSVLKDIVNQRAAPDTLPREVAADILHLRIDD